MFQKYNEIFAFQFFIVLHSFPILYELLVKLAIFLKSSLHFNSFYCLFINKNLRLNNLKTRTAMNAKISVFVISVEAIIYLLLYNLHDF